MTGNQRDLEIHFINEKQSSHKNQHLPVLYNRQQQDEIHLRLSPQFLFFDCL